MEKKGMIADRCEINRQIRADNKMLRELKAKVAKLAEAVEKSIPCLLYTSAACTMIMTASSMTIPESRG